MSNKLYCLEQCPIGKLARETFLALNDSSIVAAIIFAEFTNNCFKTCPYKNMIEGTKMEELVNENN